MKVLTIRQPWAELIARGEKLIENRSWSTSYRGPLLIHASRKRDDSRITDAASSELITGAICCMVEFIDCVPLSAVIDKPYAEGPYCWILRNPIRLRPIPIRGNLGLWSYSGFWESNGAPG